MKHVGYLQITQSLSTGCDHSLKAASNAEQIPALKVEHFNLKTRHKYRKTRNQPCIRKKVSLFSAVTDINTRIKLPTASVDNSVYKLLSGLLSDGFYYSFVKSYRNKTIIKLYSLTISYPY